MDARDDRVGDVARAAADDVGAERTPARFERRVESDDHRVGLGGVVDDDETGRDGGFGCDAVEVHTRSGGQHSLVVVGEQHERAVLGGETAFDEHR